jgi:hypothetical protein
MNCPAYKLKNDIAFALPTAGEYFILPKENLMGRTVAEVKNFVYSADAYGFSGNAQHRFHALPA